MTAPAAALATLNDLQARVHQPIIGTPAETRAAAKLADASGLVRVEVPAALLVPVPPVVVTIVCEAAWRSVRNPEGYASEQIGQYGTRRNDDDIAVYLTEVERKILRRLARRSGLRSTRMPYTAGDHADLPDTVPVVYADGRAGEPMPWRFVEDTEYAEEVPPPVPATPADDRHPG
ncbi:hypothetical protein [Lentzea sp. NBRC 102530]|uniref:hypothetical protein n=1 Tax=Lentzea sp. NBRC 102530 TaxID=3032201 RepID=UPI0024A3FB90|nr:hypothetical protein [Lentzea sp. NBRC 102530]GLY51302.1 hypothetical protein Lesp01_49580 [Lentzea sp. NBRC 102530]